MSNLELAAASRAAENQKFAGIVLRQNTSNVAGGENSAVPVGQKAVTGMPFNARAGVFLVLSSEELEVNEELQLVKGTGLLVTDSTGQVVHTSVRGILPLGKAKHLVRGDDGLWRVFKNTGKPKGKGYLRKVNVSIGKNMLFFDGQGKMRLNSWDPYYGEPLHF